MHILCIPKKVFDRILRAILGSHILDKSGSKWPKTAHIDPNSPRSPGWPEVVKQFESPNIALEILMGTSSGFDLTSSVSTLLAKENSLFKQSCLQQWLVNYITGGAVKHNLDKGLLRMSVHVGWEARDLIAGGSGYRMTPSKPQRTQTGCPGQRCYLPLAS